MLPAMAEETDLAARVPSDVSPQEGEPRWVAPVVVPRWVQLVLLPLSIIAVYIVARAAGTVLLVFVIPAVIFDADQRGLHDKTVGTVLIRA